MVPDAGFAHGRAAAPMLLTNGSYLGSLAAARDLGRSGVPITLAEPQRGSICAHSRYVTRELRSPAMTNARAWIEWMLAFGAREPGHVLFATSDDACWLLDWHRDEFEKHFRLYQPARKTIYELLNKRRLFEHCRALGIDQPNQWTEREALAGGNRLAFPVLLKPRTQAGIRPSPKGLPCSGAAVLPSLLFAARNSFSYWPEMQQYDREVSEVIVQALHEEGEQHVYSLTGFYAPECDVFALRAAEKTVQYPMRVGVGLCFEQRPVDFGLAAQLRRLFDRVGYCGPFEVEYIRAGTRSLLIDVNPRFYGQMGFEIARGLSIPRLCYAAALQDWSAVRQLATPTQAQSDEPPRFRDAWMLRLYATTHLLGGNIDLAQWRQWLEWAREHGASDPVLAPDDRAPAACFRRQISRQFLLHPRSMLRRFFVR